MLIPKDLPPQKARNTVLNELKKGTSDSKHDFRYLTMATVDPGTMEPSLRMLILRGLDSNWSFILYSDARTDKVDELLKNDKASLLFWHSYHKVQVTVKTSVTVHQNNETALDFWKKDVHGQAQKAYTPIISPGTPIEKPEEAYQWPDEFTPANFCVLECVATDLQLLQISGKEHIRHHFTRSDAEKDWSGGWIAP